MKSIPLALSISLVAVTMSAQQVAAYEAGDLIVRAGIATVAPDESSSELAIPALGGDIAGSAAIIPSWV